MSTPTPRTDAAWNVTFDSEQISAGRTARALRECSQQLETELATLRAELEKVYALVTPVGFDLPGGIFETAQAVTELRAERDQLRDEVERVNALGSWAHTCMHHNDKQRTECPVCLVTTLRAERDQLRAENATLRPQMSTPTPMPRTCGEISCDECNDRYAALAAECDQLRDQLAAARQRETVAIASWDEERGRALREGARVVELKARAKRAEADAAAERARLDSGQILLTVAGERVWHSGVDLRAAIDAAMREGAK